MKLEINENSLWYHGSNKVFDVLDIGSTITQWRQLAEAFAHKPAMLCYGDDGVILHNGQEAGYLYMIDEVIELDKDIYQHPRTTMDKNAEFFTKRLLKVKMISKLDSLTKEEINRINDEFGRMRACN